MSASFTVLADGVYQWQKDNVDISGANSSQLIITTFNLAMPAHTKTQENIF